MTDLRPVAGASDSIICSGQPAGIAPQGRSRRAGTSSSASDGNDARQPQTPRWGRPRHCPQTPGGRMKAVTVPPGIAGSVRLEEVPEPVGAGPIGLLAALVGVEAGAD